MSDSTQLHGTCISIGGKGVILSGPSGSGKSDLALRLIDEGAVLVGDDQVQITLSPRGRGWREAPGEGEASTSEYVDNSPSPQPSPTRGEGVLLASPAPNIHGMIEARGVGIVHMPYVENVPVALAVNLSPRNEIERLPHPVFWGCLGIQVPLLFLDAFHSSTPAKIRLTLLRKE